MSSQTSLLSPEAWPFNLEFLPPSAHMVGGAVRDALLGRTREYLDLDFVVPSNAVKIARKIATHYKAGFVLLDSERQIARVVFSHATADFARQEGDSLETDLRRRDFTVNAIAYNPHTQEIIDPLNGCGDIQKQILRMVSPANLEDDPLRLLRAYRQSSQLGFTIEPATQAAICSLASHITEVAAERVRVELGYMVGTPQGTPSLRSAWEAGLLTPFFKSATKESFSQLVAVDQVASQIAKSFPSFSEKLSQYIRDTIKTTWLSIAKLACLVNPQPEVAEIELQQLTYSRAENKAVTTAIRISPQLKTLSTSLRGQYFLFQEAGFVFPAIAVLAVVHGFTVEAIAPLISRYLNPDDPVAHPKQLVSGKELIIALDISASPLIGKLLTEIAIAQIEGKVSTPEQAVKLARQLTDS
jgi:tRNA nucleotidyltransferase (CCA-adding enzyme)